MNFKVVTIFGVFDGIHEGHRAFIHEAKTKGGRLVALVARDSEVFTLKGKNPMYDESTRLQMLLDISEVDDARLGDEEQGTYKILQEVNPNLIFLGYDQQALFNNISEAIRQGILSPIKLEYGTPYEPDVFHTSLLNTTHEPRN
jgi:FAD synthetase